MMKPLARFAVLALACALAACATPDKPVRPALYDFGPGSGAAAPLAAVGRAVPVLLADIDVPGSLEGTALLYRLGYADDHQLHPYALARWSAPPAQLVRHRLREVLGRDRPVLDPSDGAAVARVGESAPRVLRLDLEEFSQLFDSPSASVGLLRLRATLLDSTAAGERLLAQRSFVIREPAPSADAAGGVRALAAASDQAAEALRQWLAQQP